MSNERLASSTRLSTSTRGASDTAPTPMGTFTNSTQRQLSPLVSTPPSSTPAAPPAPATAPHTPSARLRSEPSENVVVTSDRAAGDTSAAPSPWIARAPSSQASDWASPPTSEASENSTSPYMNIRRRPTRSASRPPSSRQPPNVSVYAFTTHERSAREKLNPLPIDGSATLTIDASITITNCVIASSASATFLACGVSRLAPVAVPVLTAPTVDGPRETWFSVAVFPLPVRACNGALAGGVTADADAPAHRPHR